MQVIKAFLNVFVQRVALIKKLFRDNYSEVTGIQLMKNCYLCEDDRILIFKKIKSLKINLNDI